MLRDEYEKKHHDQNIKATSQVASEVRKGFDAKCKMKDATGELARMRAEHQEELRRQRAEIEEKDRELRRQRADFDAKDKERRPI